ncbi:MAG: NRDE family protein [Moraxella osloensis]
MCIVALAWQLFEDKPLVLLSNRDEFLQRPTRALHEWQLPNGKNHRGARCASRGHLVGYRSCAWALGVILNYREIIKDKPVFATSAVS